MLRYIAVRTVWIFIVLITFLSLLFITIRRVPEYPPAEKDARDIYYVQQERDGYMTSELIRDQARMRAIRNGTEEICGRCYYTEEGGNLRLYTPVSIAVQYGRFVKN